MKRSLAIIVGILIVIIAGAYIYLRTSLLKTRDFKADTSKATSVLDLRPQLIAKLQQLVKDGSKGLYRLDIDQIEPQLTQAKLKVVKALLTPDTATLALLDRQQQAPDDVFKVAIDSFFIDGLGAGDLLSLKNINLKSIYINEPVVDVFHSERSYNKKLPRDTASLYEKLSKQFTSLSIGNIVINKGAFITHNLASKKVSRYKNINLALGQVLVDSTTQYDSSRFFFAKQAEISMNDYVSRTGDSLYFLKCKSLKISAVAKTVVADNIELLPRGNLQQFQKKLTKRLDMFTIKIPRLTLSGIDWWRYLNSNKLVAAKADIYNCSFYDYLNRGLPLKKFKINNYPHQSIMKMPLQLKLSEVNVHNMNVGYQELNPNAARSGTMYFDNLNGQMKNLTNMPEAIRKNNIFSFKLHTRFMHRVPANITFRFDMAKTKTGVFSAEIHTGSMDTAILNPLAEPLGLFYVKSISVKKADIFIRGDNYKTNGNFTLLYDDLYLIPLKKEADDGKLKKRKLLAVLANILIKNANPGNDGKVRTFTYWVQRERHPNFFNQAWKTILYGLIETIGAPKKFAK